MAWIELHLTTSKDHVSLLSDQLTLLGAEAVTFKDAANQPIYEPALNSTPIWQETIVVGLFDDQQAMDAILDYIEKQKTAGLLKQFEVKLLADQDWERSCLVDFKPLSFGKHLWICPSWLTPPDPSAVTVILDPGLAFGTGTHAATALCLEWLEANIQSGETAIDYGCGSGILGLAALKLGASYVKAVDYDQQALVATRQNAIRNHYTSAQLETFLPDELVTEPVDVVIANILAQPLIDLAPRLASFVKPGGRILLSGILIEQAEKVTAAYEPWFVMKAPVVQGDWVRLEGSCCAI